MSNFKVEKFEKKKQERGEEDKNRKGVVFYKLSTTSTTLIQFNEKLILSVTTT